MDNNRHEQMTLEEELNDPRFGPPRKPMSTEPTPAPPQPEPEPSSVEKELAALNVLKNLMSDVRIGATRAEAPTNQRQISTPLVGAQSAVEWVEERTDNDCSHGSYLRRSQALELAERCDKAEKRCSQWGKIAATQAKERMKCGTEIAGLRVQLAVENQKRMEAEMQAVRDAKRADENAVVLAAPTPPPGPKTETE